MTLGWNTKRIQFKVNFTTNETKAAQTKKETMFQSVFVYPLASQVGLAMRF